MIKMVSIKGVSRYIFILSIVYVLLVVPIATSMNNDIQFPQLNVNKQIQLTKTGEIQTLSDVLKDLSNPSVNGKQDTILVTGTVKWTILIYINADNDLENEAIKDIKEMLKGSKFLSDCACVLIQIDRHSSNNTAKGYTSEPLPGESKEYTGARRYQLASNGSLIPRQDLGEVNMASGKTLDDFVKWGRQQCQSEKVALIIWNHGAGDMGVSVDEGNKNDILQLPEIRRVLQNYKRDAGKPLDLLGFDACLMAASEVVSEFVGLTNVMVASEETEPGEGWDYYALFREFGKGSCNNTEYDFGRIIVGTYGKYYGMLKKNKTTLVAIDMASYSHKFEQAMKAFTKKLSKMLQNKTIQWKIARAIEWARNHSYEFGDGNQIDLYQFLELLQRAVDDLGLRKLIQEVLDVILFMRFARHGGRTAVNATGISIYFKKNSPITYTYKGAASIRFNKTTDWAKVIKSYMSIHKNSSYREWVKSNPIKVASPVEVIGSLYPATQAPPTVPTAGIMPSDGYLFDGRLEIPSELSFPDGGWIHIYEQIFGSRQNNDPIESIWIDSLPSGSIFDFEFIWHPTESGWLSLRMDFQPYQPDVFPQLPSESHNGFDFNFIQEAPQDPFYIPPPEVGIYPIWLINPPEIPLLVGNTISYGIEIINVNSNPFLGGTLAITAIETETGTNIPILSTTLPPIDSGENVIIPFDFTPTLPGFYEFNASIDGIPIIMDDNAPKEWASVAPTLPVYTTDMIITEFLETNVLLDNGFGMYDPTELPFHATNWTNQDIFLEFRLPGSLDASDLQAIDFNFTAGYPSWPIVSISSVLLPNDWTKNADGFLYAIYGPIAPFDPFNFYEGGLFSMNAMTNVTDSENILNPAFWEFMPQPDMEMPDVLLEGLSAEFDPFAGNMTLTLTARNDGNRLANGTYAGMFIGATLPNGTFVSIETVMSSLPDIPPNETVVWQFTVPYSQFAAEGFHNIITHLSYDSATWDRSAKETNVFIFVDDIDPSTDPLFDPSTDIIKEMNRDSLDPLFDDEPEPIVEGTIEDEYIDPFDEPFLESEVEAPTLENEDILFDVSIDDPFFGPLSSTPYLEGGNIARFNFTIYAKTAQIPVGTHPIYVFFYDEGYNSYVVSFNLTINYNPLIIEHTPSPVEMTEGENKSLSWVIYDEDYGTYEIKRNNSLVQSGTWNGTEEISYNLENLVAGIYIFFINVTDSYGISVNETITVSVSSSPTSTPTTSFSTTTTFTETKTTITSISSTGISSTSETTSISSNSEKSPIKLFAILIMIGIAAFGSYRKRSKKAQL